MPHDLVRDLLDADLRWRDTPIYREVFRALHDHAMAEIGSANGRSQQQATADLKYLFRKLRHELVPGSWGSGGGHYPDRAAPEDRPAILALVAAAEGNPSAAIAVHWLDRQPEGFHVLRGANAELRGIVVLLDLTHTTDEDRRVDPGAEAAWRYAEATAPSPTLADDALLVPEAHEPELLVLAHADFADAVRQALRDLHRPDLLARNPLARTRLVAGTNGSDSDRLRGLVLRAVAKLAEDARDDPLYRAMTHTYVETARTQEAAAHSLRVPFSSYRRHFAKGTDRLIAWLWQRELGSAGGLE